MKLNIELTNDKFKFDWKIGEESMGGVAPMNVGTLKLFINLCDNLYRFQSDDIDKKIKEIGARAWVETHLEEYKDMLDKKNKK